MTGHLSERTRWAIVMAFAIAMAWVEAASVFYIRALVDRIEPYQADPLPMNGALGNVELWREAATLVMIATLGLLAGRTWRRRAGYAALAFGAWDIFYYVFLRLISGWPRTLLDWDILFLLPLPWWGPVLAPVSIALVMILWGTLATQSGDGAADARWAWALACVGIVLALAVFMIDAWRALPDGRDAVLQVLPTTFNWPLFWVALLLMASPALHQVAFLHVRPSPSRGNPVRGAAPWQKTASPVLWKMEDLHHATPSDCAGFLFVFGLAGCGSSAAPMPTPLPTVQGRWQGTITSPADGVGTITADLIQSGPW